MALFTADRTQHRHSRVRCILGAHSACACHQHNSYYWTSLDLQHFMARFKNKVKTQLRLPLLLHFPNFKSRRLPASRLYFLTTASIFEMVLRQFREDCKAKAIKASLLFRPLLYHSISTNEKYQVSEGYTESHEELLSNPRNSNPGTNSRLSWLFSGLFFMVSALMLMTGLALRWNFESRCYETANFYCELASDI